MSGAKEALREEVAALAETIRELREELATVRAQPHHCHGCGCLHLHYQPYVAPYVYPGITWTSQPYQVTCGVPGAAGGNSTVMIDAATTTTNYAQVMANTACANPAPTTCYLVN